MHIHLIMVLNLGSLVGKEIPLQIGGQRIYGRVIVTIPERGTNFQSKYVHRAHDKTIRRITAEGTWDWVTTNMRKDTLYLHNYSNGKNPVKKRQEVKREST